jgi:N-acetylglutamate synthase-like GNAT family acetyltransferase
MVQPSLYNYISKPNLLELASINPCSPEDYSDLRELQKITIKSNGWHFYSIHEVESRLREIDNPDYTYSLLEDQVLVAHINRFLIGTAAWRPDSNHPQTAVITQIYVHPFFTDGGIATALIQRIERDAYHKGYRFVSALSDLNSRLLFSKLGYEGKGFEFSQSDHSTQYPLQIMARKIAANDIASPDQNSADKQTFNA